MASQAKHSQSILIVDGDILVRHAIADYLRECGYVVVEAASVDEAVIVVGEADLAVAAILCDAEAPGAMNAFQFRVWAREQRQDVEIALAGNVDAAAHKAAELCEEGPHLQRPYDPQGVVSYVRRLLGGGSEGRRAAPS